jgi:ABC-2 type transport system ATP-binding protein
VLFIGDFYGKINTYLLNIPSISFTIGDFFYMIFSIMDDQISIKVDGVTKLYGNNPAVEGLSFVVHKGTIHGFLGPNGAGKSTTMRMIAGLLSPTKGHLFVNGQDVHKNLTSTKKSIGILLEIPPLYKDMEVKEYLHYVAKLHMVPKQQISERVNTVLSKLSIEDVASRLIGNLSKGYKQRVGVAQAIIHNPDIVILDEPTVGLDPSAVIEMRSLITELKNDHTILLSSHLLHEVGLICDEVTIIDRGRLLTSGTMDEISAKLVGKNIINATIANADMNLLKDMQKADFIQRLELTEEEGVVKVSFYTDSINDHRSWISRKIFEGGMDLLEFSQEKRNLEQIFLEVTGGHE